MWENFLILSGLLTHRRELEVLMGAAWRGLDDRVVELLKTVVRAGVDPAVRSDVDDLLLALFETPASSLVRTIMRQATARDTVEQTRRATYDRLPADTVPSLALKQLAAQVVENAERADAPESDADTDNVGEMRINAWLTERPEGAGAEEPLEIDHEYTLNLNVGRPIRGSLVPGSDALIAELDIPASGLELRWAVSSSTVELTAGDPEVSVTLDTLGVGSRLWTARFTMRVFPRRDGATRRIRVSPRHSADARLDVLIYSGREIYRDFRIAFSVAGDTSTGRDASTPTIGIIGDTCHAPASHLNLRTTHEWTTPPGELTMFIAGQAAHVNGEAAGKDVAYITPWQVSAPQLAGRMENVRSAADRFRVGWESYLNDIDPAGLPGRLANAAARYEWPYDWSNLPNHADATHEKQWQAVAASPELRELSVYGRQLYDAVFPLGSPLRAEIDGLQPGHRLNVIWPSADVSDVPWGLMYALDPPMPGAAVDPTGFLSFRFRVEHKPYPLQGGAKSLGGPVETRRACLLYWGTQAGDTAALEARWQRSEWTPLSSNLIVPDEAAQDPKGELLRFFSTSHQAPVSIVYLFCHCSVGAGNDPVLRFGPTIQPKDVIKGIDLPQRLTDRPLVFVNACTSSASDPYKVNDLEWGFLSGGCRAYIGTESKVPVQFASRFGWVFLRFLLRLVDPQPMAAGEAAAQARLFFWTHYRNIGGVFYSYVNQYELFAATDTEVRALGR